MTWMLPFAAPFVEPFCVEWTAILAIFFPGLPIGPGNAIFMTGSTTTEGGDVMGERGGLMGARDGRTGQ